jgi:hypothetical protein
MQTSYGCIFQKKTSVAAIYITLGVPGLRADKIGAGFPISRRPLSEASKLNPPHRVNGPSALVHAIV